MRYSCLLGLVLATPCLLAQQSMFESGDGRTSLYLRQPAAAVNFGDSKASLAYVHDYSKPALIYGASAYATANSGISSLFSSDKAKAPEGGVSGIVGFRLDKKHTDGTGDISMFNNRFLVDGGYGRSSFYLYPTGATPSAAVSKTNFNRFRAIGVWNLRTDSWVFGLASGAERRNNLSELKSVNLDTVVLAAPSGGTSSLVKSQAGYYGVYKTYVAAPVYQDALWELPPWKDKHFGIDGRFAIDFLTRSDVASVNRSVSGGLGLFIVDKKDPYKVIGGITGTFDGSKFQLSLTTGLTASAK